MQVILLERIEKLGQMGDEVGVRPGYARNYLLPRRKALRATPENRTRFERERAQLETANEARRSEAATSAGAFEGHMITLLRQASEGDQLYGSVSARDIARALGEDGFTVDRRQVVLDQPIKMLGIHDVRVALHPEVYTAIRVNVSRSREEAELRLSGDYMTEAERAAEEMFEDVEAAHRAVEELVEEEEALEAASDEATDTAETETEGERQADA